MDKNEFFTRQKANQGVKLFLPDARTGQLTDEWIRVLGKESDAYRAEDHESHNRIHERLVAVGTKDKTALDAAAKSIIREETFVMLASLITEWSFGELTREEAVEFLREAPQIADMIDNFTSNRSLFFDSVASSSSTTPTPNSSSTESQKAVDSPSEPV